MSETFDERMMRRAIALARTRLGLTDPNPTVGCLLVKDGQVIAEAATGAGGRPHAEEQALAAAGDTAEGATAYVTLEPCGRRSSGAPSCSERLVKAKVGRVVIACKNPEGLSAGQGVSRLKAAGVPVGQGLLGDEAEAALYRDFLRELKSGQKD